MNVLMLCPSRGRPSNIAELIKCWQDTTVSARLMVLTDSDDPALPAYESLPWAENIVHLTGPPSRIGPLLNLVAPPLARDADVIGFLGDDHRPRTLGWDTILAAHLDRPGVAYGDDLLQREKLPTACLISSVIIRTLGYMVPPGMIHLYLDDFWKMVGTETGNLVYDPGVIMEHMHPVAGKGVMDEGYLRNNSSQLYADDFAAYQNFLQTRWPADAAKLKGITC